MGFVGEQRLFQGLMAILLAVLVVVVFLAGMLVNQRTRESELLVQQVESQLTAEQIAELSQLRREITQLESELAQLSTANTNYAEREGELLATISGLRGRVAGIETVEQPANSTNSRRYPFIVPSTGVAASIYGTFDNVIYGMDHLGIDIWTSSANGGRIASHKGNPVYAACSGRVVSFMPENGGVTIDCDPISGDYSVPERDVFTHYAHLGNGVTKETYFEVSRGQRVDIGDLLGYQGDLSSFFPNMRNVHLHFSVFTGVSEADPNGGAINPCLYIGGSCVTQGETFTVGI